MLSIVGLGSLPCKCVGYHRVFGLVGHPSCSGTAEAMPHAARAGRCQRSRIVYRVWGLEFTGLGFDVKGSRVIMIKLLGQSELSRA